MIHKLSCERREAVPPEPQTGIKTIILLASMRQCLSSRRPHGVGELSTWILRAALNLCLSVRCEGNANKVDYSFCKIDVRGDDEQLVWVLCKPSQQKQGIGAISAAECRYPNLLVVNDDFSRNTVKLCFAEALEGEQKKENANAVRITAIEESNRKVAELQNQIDAGRSSKLLSDEELGILEEQVKGLRSKIEAHAETTKNLDVDSMKKSFRLYSYDFDLDALIGQLVLNRDKVRAELGKEVEEVGKRGKEADMRAYVDEESSDLPRENIVQKYYRCTWRVEDLIKLNIARREPYNEETYYRYDNQAQIHISQRTVPQLDIFRPWVVLFRWTDVLNHNNSLIAKSTFDELLREYEAVQKSLRQCLAYAILRLSRRKLNEILSIKPTDKAETLNKTFTAQEFSSSPPSETYHVLTSALVRQQDFCKDLSGEISIQKTKEEKQIEEQEAKHA